MPSIVNHAELPSNYLLQFITVQGLGEAYVQMCQNILAQLSAHKWTNSVLPGKVLDINMFEASYYIYDENIVL